jgi:hypothetical protein
MQDWRRLLGTVKRLEAQDVIANPSASNSETYFADSDLRMSLRSETLPLTTLPTFDFQSTKILF